ncbi:methyltransferase [Streptosporangium sp. NPDC051023]|uniref:methyltransferase n=1 Tax=Streptosporangium sp. NPDC051023 TaxID=3155410 RepID=UPI00344B1A7D
MNSEQHPPLPRGASPSAEPLVQPHSGTLIERILDGEPALGTLLAVAVLGVADHLSDQARTVTELAGLCEADEASLRRILRAASILGLLRSTDTPDHYALTTEGARLRSDAADSMLPAVLMAADPFWREAIRTLPQTVRDGHPTPRTPWPHLAETPDAQGRFQRSMTARTTPIAAALAKRDYSTVRTVVDVGGGHGTVLAALLTEHSHLSGVLLDLPGVAEEGGTHLDALGLRERVEVVVGDFFEAVPSGGQVYVLVNVLHNWGDSDAMRILCNVRTAIEASGNPAQVWCVDLLLSPVRAHAAASALADLADIRMMSLYTQGQERTFYDYMALMAAAGLTVADREHLPGDMHLMIAEVVPAERI